MNYKRKYNWFYKHYKEYWKIGPNRLVKRAVQYLPKKGVALDLGSGQGRDSMFLSQHGFLITAVDYSRVGIRQLKKICKERKIKNIIPVCMNVKNFKIEKNKYHFIFAGNIFQFLSKDVSKKIILNSQKGIKKKGIIAINAFTVNDPSYLDEKKLPTYFEKGELKKLFKEFTIKYYYEGMMVDMGHGHRSEPHKHGIVSIIAQKK